MTQQPAPAPTINYSNPFAGIVISDQAKREAESDIAFARNRYEMSRLEACDHYAHVLAGVIAEDAVLGTEQYQSRLDRYVYVTREAATARADLHALAGLAEHTAAACDTITRAAR